MKKRVILLVAAAGLGAFAACRDRATTEPATLSKRNAATQNGNRDANGVNTIAEVTGRITRNRVLERADGSRWLTTEVTDLQQSYKKDGTPNANVSANAFKSEDTQIANPSIRRASFGSPAADTIVNGRTYKRTLYKTQRMAAKRIDGRNVELYRVPSADGKHPVGYVIMIDGTMRQQVELTYRADEKKLAAVRALSYDKDGHFLAEDVADVSNVEIAEKLLVAERSGLQKTFGRLLRGTANLVLPDQLQAQDPIADPCKSYAENLTLYTELVLANTAIANVTLAACIAIGVVPFAGQLACSAAAAAAITLAGLIVTAEHYDSLLSACRETYPTCGSTWGSNGSCSSTGSGGGNGGGSFGGTGAGSGATGSSGGGSLGGGMTCETYEWFDPETFTTHSVTSCHPI